MPEKEIDCSLTRDQALHVARRYGLHWDDGATIDDAAVGEGTIPDFQLRVEFKSADWPRDAVVSAAWDEMADAEGERYKQLQALLRERGVAFTER
ncbi:MAG: hypothetical protein JWM53_2458 [bacterium]|nr:hypothetical protein [bacterium]